MTTLGTIHTFPHGGDGICTFAFLNFYYFLPALFHLPCSLFDAILSYMLNPLHYISRSSHVARSFMGKRTMDVVTSRCAKMERCVYSSCCSFCFLFFLLFHLSTILYLIDLFTKPPPPPSPPSPLLSCNIYFPGISIYLEPRPPPPPLPLVDIEAGREQSGLTGGLLCFYSRGQKD